MHWCRRNYIHLPNAVMRLPSCFRTRVEDWHVLFKPFGQWWVARIVGDDKWCSVHGLLFRPVLLAVGKGDGLDFADC